MKDNYGELVNKYIDNELTKNELNKLDELVKTNNKFNNILRVQSYVHNSLSHIPLKQVHSGFTDLVMNKIIHKISDKYKKNYLFRGVISVLIFMLIFTLFGFFYFLSDLEMITNFTNSATTFTDHFLPSLSYFYKVINTEIFKTVSGIIGFIVLVGFYFNYNSHKHTKDLLNEL